MATFRDRIFGDLIVQVTHANLITSISFQFDTSVKFTPRYGLRKKQKLQYGRLIM